MSVSCRGCIYFLSLKKSSQHIFCPGLSRRLHTGVGISFFSYIVFALSASEDWDMLDVDEDEKLTGEEEFELLAGPLGLSERRIVPESVQFPDSDPLGASIAMVTATNSMEETLLQIGEVED